MHTSVLAVSRPAEKNRNEKSIARTFENIVRYGSRPTKHSIKNRKVNHWLNSRKQNR